MGCAINKVILDSGESSLLFSQLQEDMGDSLALENYLELQTNKDYYAKIYGLNSQGEINGTIFKTTPKFKEVNFKDYQEELDITELLTDDLLSLLKEHPLTKSETSLSGIRFTELAKDPTLIPKLINTLQQNLRAELAENNYDEERTALFQQAIDNLPNYLITKDGRLGIIGKALENYGVSINIQQKPTEIELLEDNESEIQGATNFEDIQYEYMRIYSMSILQTNPASSISPDLRAYLHTLKEVDSYNPNTGEIKYVKSKLGHPRKADFGSTLNKLFKAVVGVQSMEAMLRNLEDAAKLDKSLAPIYKDIITTKPVYIKNIGEVNLLTTALYSLAKQDYNMLNVVETLSGDVVVMNANSRTVAKTIASEWAQSVEDKRKLNNTALIGRIKNFLDSPTNTRDINRKNSDGEYIPSRVVLSSAAELFQSAGFSDVTTDVLKTAIVRANINPGLLGAKNTTPAEALRTMIRVLPQKAVTSKLPITKSEDSYGENKTLNYLAGIVGEERGESNLSSYRNSKNTVTHPRNNGSESQDIFSRITEDTQDAKDYIEDFRKDPIYRDTILLNILDSTGRDKLMFEVQTMGELANNLNRTAHDWGELSSFDALALRMNTFFGPKNADARYFQALSPTLADRRYIKFLTVPKLNYTDLSRNSGTKGPVFGSAENILAPDISEWMYNQVKGELERMLGSGNISTYTNYNNNAYQFNLFKTLNGKINPNLSLENLEMEAVRLMPYAHKELSMAINSDIQTYIDNGILEKDGINYKIPKSVSKQFSGKIPTVITKADMETFLVNNFIYTYEQLLFLTGDPAFYSSSTNINKRLNLPTTPGIKPAVGDNTGLPKYAYVKIIQEPEVTSELAQLWGTIIDEKGKVGKDIKIADGYGMISIDYYRRLLVSQGIHNDEILDMLDKAEKIKDPKSKEAIGQIASLKKFYYKIHMTEEGFMAPFALKYSVFPAIPALFEAVGSDGKYLYPGLNVISKELRLSKTDEIVVPSAVKVGQRYITTIDKLSSAKPIEIHNDAVRFPQPASITPKVEDLLGSQIRKLIIGNLVAGGIIQLDNNTLTELEGLEFYNDAISVLINLGAKDVKDKLTNEHGEIDNSKVISEFISGALDNSYQNSEYAAEALLTQNSDQESLLPLTYPTLKYKLDSWITSRFRKAVNRFKVNGHSAVQISNMGMASLEDGSLSVAGDLKFVGFETINGGRVDAELALELAAKVQDHSPENLKELSKYKVSEAEIRVSPAYFIATINNLAKEKINKEEIYNKVREFSKKYGETRTERDALFKVYRDKLMKEAIENNMKKFHAILYNSDGSFNMEAIRKNGLDKIVLYRIPTQGKNSMLPAKIIEFLPINSINTIQVPGEIVEQSGADFDIDKVYIEFNSFNIKNGEFTKDSYLDENGSIILDSKKAARNFITDFHRGILTSMQHVAELLAPNTTKTLKKIIQDKEISESSSPFFASATAQEEFRVNNRAGKEMISRSSISGVGHAVAPHIGTEFIKSFSIGGEPISLGNKFNRLEGKEKNLISRDIEEIQNAAVDNASTPLLGILNIDSFTSSAALLLISAGTGLKHAIDMLDAPIIKRLAKLYPKYERQDKEGLALKKAVRQVSKEFKVTSADTKMFSSDLYTSQMAEALIKGRTPAEHGTALQAFLYFKERGEELADFQLAMNIDSSGVPSSVSGLINAYNTAAGISGTETNALKAPLIRGMGKTSSRSAIRVSPELYKSSHLSTFEKNTIHEPLQILQKISPSASVQMQRVLTQVRDAIGYLPEIKEIGVLSNYDTYLAHNNKAYSESTSNLSTEITEGKHDYLVQASSPDSAANLLKAYRQWIKSTGRTENKFTKKLEIEVDEGLHFVLYNNTNTSGILGSEKTNMMNFFKSLMFSQHPIERKLAKALTNYALVNYGYSTGINSYMEAIPPVAHSMYNEVGTSLPQHFRTLEKAFNNKEDFSILNTFVTQYVQNYIDILPIKTVFSPFDILEIEEDITNEFLFTGRISDKYLKLGNSKNFLLYEFNPTVFKFQQIQRRGIPNLIVEFHTGISKYNSDISIESEATAEKTKDITENKKAVEEIDNQRTELLAAIPDISNKTINSLQDALNIASIVSKNLIATKYVSKTFAENIEEYIASVAESSNRVYTKKMNSGTLKGDTLESMFKNSYNILKKDLLASAIEGELLKHICKS